MVFIRARWASAWSPKRPRVRSTHATILECSWSSSRARGRIAPKRKRPRLATGPLLRLAQVRLLHGHIGYRAFHATIAAFAAGLVTRSAAADIVAREVQHLAAHVAGQLAVVGPEVRRKGRIKGRLVVRVPQAILHS